MPEAVKRVAVPVPTAAGKLTVSLVKSDRPLPAAVEVELTAGAAAGLRKLEDGLRANGVPIDGPAGAIQWLLDSVADASDDYDAARAVKVVEVPMVRTVGYVPCSFGINLTGEQAQTLADLRRGFTERGFPTSSFSEAVGVLLDRIRQAPGA